jgi:uncharacterized membrane protein YjfL (UPF0719 family)
VDIDYNTLWVTLYSNTTFIILYLLALKLGKWINDEVTPYSIDEQIISLQNLALATSYLGYTLAITIIYIGALLGPSEGFIADLLKVSGYSVLGIILLNVARGINNRLILYKFHNITEVIDQQNVGTGSVQAGSYIASALIIAAAIHGEGGSLLTALVLFAVAQLAMVGMTYVYNKITPFDIHHEIEQGNVAAGIAFSGSLIGVGILLSKGVSGYFVSWQTTGWQLLEYSLVAFILLPIFRLVFDKLIIPGVDLNQEISEHQNVGAGLLEFAGTIGFSIVVYFLI